MPDQNQSPNLPDLSGRQSPSPKAEASSPEPSPSPEPEREGAQASTTSFSAPHLEGLETDDPELRETQAPGDGDSDSAAGLLSREHFYSMFQVAFAAPNLLPAWPLPLEALPIKAGEDRAARAASDAIYDIALETPALRWLIEPQSVWLQRLMVIGAFAVPKAAAVSREIAHKRGGLYREKQTPRQEHKQPAAGSPHSDAKGEPKPDAEADPLGDNSPFKRPTLQ